jgi:hypothetical protein
MPRIVCVILLSFALVGCSSLSPVDRAWTQYLFGGGVNAQAVQPNTEAADSRLSYLRVQSLGGFPVVFVLGYVDASPTGAVEVWYSGQREVLKIQNGRVVEMAGVPHGWAQAGWSPMPPDWLALPPAGAKVVRQRDVPAEYRFSVQDALFIQPQAVPPSERGLLRLPPTVSPAMAAGWRWFSETSDNLPTAWFAWGHHAGSSKVVYSFQCLSPTFCLHIQPWPAEGASNP